MQTVTIPLSGTIPQALAILQRLHEDEQALRAWRTISGSELRAWRNSLAEVVIAGEGGPNSAKIQLLADPAGAHQLRVEFDPADRDGLFGAALALAAVKH